MEDNQNGGTKKIIGFETQKRCKSWMIWGFAHIIQLRKTKKISFVIER